MSKKNKVDFLESLKTTKDSLCLVKITQIGDDSYDGEICSDFYIIPKGKTQKFIRRFDGKILQDFDPGSLISSLIYKVKLLCDVEKEDLDSPLMECIKKNTYRELNSYLKSLELEDPDN